MPPKGSQKAKAPEVTTPKTKAKPKPAPIATNAPTQASPAATPTPTPKKADATPPKKAATTPRKKKEAATFTAMNRDEKAPIPIDVKYEGEAEQAKKVSDGVYGHTLKLDAANAFKLYKTILFTEGEYAGCQAIILQPAKPFPFLKLPKETRARIYSYYFAANRVVGAPIPLEGKKTNKIFAKMYSEGSANRVGLLTVNREIYEEALPILYDHALKFENTTTLLDFLGQIQNTIRARITKVHIKQFVKTTARNAMHFLAESPNIIELKIDSGIHTGDDPAKAAREFFDNSYKFLEAVGGRKGDKAAAVDVLEFGNDAFMFKAEKGEDHESWDDEEVDEFKTALKAKLKSLRFSMWVCLCGSMIQGHSCSDEFNFRALKKQHRQEWDHIRHGASTLAAL